MTAEADMIWPDPQQADCTASQSNQAFWIFESADAPILSTDMTLERVATPATCTVRTAPSATHEPNFVPVTPGKARNTTRAQGPPVDIDRPGNARDLDREDHGFHRVMLPGAS
jgi:hypothetical protein